MRVVFRSKAARSGTGADQGPAASAAAAAASALYRPATGGSCPSVMQCTEFWAILQSCSQRSGQQALLRAKQPFAKPPPETSCRPVWYTLKANRSESGRTRLARFACRQANASQSGFTFALAASFLPVGCYGCFFVSFTLTFCHFAKCGASAAAAAASTASA